MKTARVGENPPEAQIEESPRVGLLPDHTCVARTIYAATQVGHRLRAKAKLARQEQMQAPLRDTVKVRLFMSMKETSRGFPSTVFLWLASCDSRSLFASSGGVEAKNSSLLKVETS